MGFDKCITLSLSYKIFKKNAIRDGENKKVCFSKQSIIWVNFMLMWTAILSHGDNEPDCESMN